MISFAFLHDGIPTRPYKLFYLCGRVGMLTCKNERLSIKTKKTKRHKAYLITECQLRSFLFGILNYIWHFFEKMYFLMDYYGNLDA